MNKARRKRLGEAFEKIGEVKDILDEVRDEEQDAYDNLPESFQNSERGEEMQNYIEMIDEAYGYLEDAESVVDQV